MMKIKTAVAVGMLLALTAQAQDGAEKAAGKTEKAAKKEKTKAAPSEKTPPAKLVKDDKAKDENGKEWAKTGTGKKAEAGKTVTVHYTGWLWEAGKPNNKGTKFDSSVDRGDPFKFTLGEGRVIQGWEKGIDGMKVGGKRRLIIPSNMGYGPSGTPGGPIPPNATLIFDVELLGVE